MNTTPSNNIVLLTELYPPAVGGSAVLFHEIYRRVPGAQVAVVTEPRRDRRAGPGRGRMGIIEHPVATGFWGLSHPAGARHHLRTAAAVRRLLRHGGGVVHCGRALPEGLAAWLARQFGGPKYVCWAHGEDLVTARSSREYEFLTTRILRNATFCIANSRNTASLIAGFGVPERRIRLVYPGVDADRFAPSVDGRDVRRRLGLAADEMVLLSVGRLQRRKGHDVAIRTMARLRNRVAGLRYLIVGNGEERAYLQGLIEQAGVGDIVQMVGEVPDHELPQFYAACDLFLLPNRVERGDIEGFGIVFLEAASTARPVIAGRSGGVAEAVEDGITGLLVGGTDEEELAGAIASLAGSPAMRQQMGAAGRARVQRLFTWQQAAASIAALQAEAARD